MVISRGQVVIGRKALAETLHLSEQQIRTALSKLISTNEITTKSTNHETIVTICKYDTYQSFNEENQSQSTNGITNNITIQQPTDNQRITTSNKDNKLIKKENTLSISPVGGDFFGLYEQMMVVYKKSFPTYFKDDKVDYPACNHIAKKIEILKEWEHGSCMNGRMKEFLDEWEKMTVRLTTNTWLSQMTLTDLSDKQWQKWCTSMANMEKGTDSKQARADKSKAAKEAAEKKSVNLQALNYE
jgi:hypothetical protein